MIFLSARVRYYYHISVTAAKAVNTVGGGGSGGGRVELGDDFFVYSAAESFGGLPPAATPRGRRLFGRGSGQI